MVLMPPCAVDCECGLTFLTLMFIFVQSLGITLFVQKKYPHMSLIYVDFVKGIIHIYIGQEVHVRQNCNLNISNIKYPYHRHASTYDRATYGESHIRSDMIHKVGHVTYS